MYFELDNQTRKDLDILTGNNNLQSIFSLFNHNITKGGENKLLSFFDSPSSDISLLNNRKNNTLYLYENKLIFMITFNQFAFIEHYMKMSRIPLRDNILNAISDRISYFFKPSNDYYLIKSGIQNLYLLSEQMVDFLDAQKKLQIPPFFEEMNLRFCKFIKLIKKNSKLTRKKQIKSRSLNKLDRIFRKTSKSLVKEVLNDIYFLDSYISIGITLDKLGLCFAEYYDSKKPYVKLTSLFHPFLKNPVCNDFELGKGKTLCFLTGPNMAGKSTLLKSLGISLFLAHIGLPVPAKSMETTIFRGLITTINLADNISLGYSHYFSEVKRVKDTCKKMLENKQLFVIFDEMFRGTNVKDALEASHRIINEFSSIRECLFLISSHINEIADHIKSDQLVSYKKLESISSNNGLKYDYILKSGISSERMGIKILEKENVFQILKQINCKQH